MPIMATTDMNRSESYDYVLISCPQFFKVSQKPRFQVRLRNTLQSSKVIDTSHSAPVDDKPERIPLLELRNGKLAMKQKILSIMMATRLQRIPL